MRAPGTTHLAGIIPLAHEPLDFSLDWHDSLMPIAPNYYAFERSVYECALAGCHTIWIVANDDLSPLLRHRIGDFIQDPVFLRRHGKYPSKDRRPIPIFYIPMKEYDRACFSWSIIHGILTANNISGDISKWLKPEKFYISFPYGVYDPEILREHRQDIIKEDNFFLTHEDRSARTGDYLGFTLNKEQLLPCIEKYEEYENRVLFDQNIKKHLSLDKMLSDVIIDNVRVELERYNSIDSWNGYRDYMGSELSQTQKHPGQLVMSYREWNPIGEEKHND